MENPRILVVEDEAITAMDIRARLEKLNYGVVDTLFTGEEAIAIAGKEKPDLILMDIILKGKMDGTEAANFITNNYHIPIIFLTAYNDNQTFDRAKMSLPYGYLTKPFETRDLQIAIELALYRHDMEKKLNVAQKYHSILMDNASCGIFTHDSDGIVYDVNKKAESMFGDIKTNIVGSDFKKYILPSEIEFAKVMLRKISVEKSIESHEGHFLQPNGNIIDLEFTASCVNLGGKELILSILTDMTATNKLRNQAILNDKLALVGTLSAGIIHEINNPLSWMLANLSALNKNLQKLKAFKDEALIAEFKELTTDTLEGAHRIHDIVNSLKGFARADDSEISRVEINKIIDKVIKIVSGETKNSIKVEKDFQTDLPLLFISSGKLQQVILNILINAIQAFPDKNLNTNLILITTRLLGNNILIEISDNGAGISLEDRDKIFDPFFTTKPTGKGTGLGLSICYDIIHHFRGKITVNSEPGKGSMFCISLPLQLNPAKLKKAGDDLRQHGSKSNFKVLVIDDEPLMLKSIKKILGAEYTITEIEGGRKAIRILEKEAEQYDVIISDLHMPDVSGADLYRYVADKYPGKEIRFIFLTGSTSSDVQDNFIKNIPNKIFAKPVDQNELICELERICYGNIEQ